MGRGERGVGLSLTPSASWAWPCADRRQRDLGLGLTRRAPFACSYRDHRHRARLWALMYQGIKHRGGPVRRAGSRRRAVVCRRLRTHRCANIEPAQRSRPIYHSVCAPKRRGSSAAQTRRGNGPVASGTRTAPDQDPCPRQSREVAAGEGDARDRTRTPDPTTGTGGMGGAPSIGKVAAGARNAGPESSRRDVARKRPANFRLDALEPLRANIAGALGPAPIAGMRAGRQRRLPAGRTRQCDRHRDCQPPAAMRGVTLPLRFPWRVP